VCDAVRVQVRNRRDDLPHDVRCVLLRIFSARDDLIEQLTSACKRMEAACNAKDVQVSRVSSQLHSVAAVIAQQAASLAVVEDEEKVDRITASDYSQQLWQPPAFIDSHTAHHPYSNSQAHSRAYSQPHFLARSGPQSPSHSHSHPYHSYPPPNSASTFLSVLPSSTSSYLLHSDSSHTLRQSTNSLLETFSMTVVVLPSKVVIDVNELFLRMTGHTRAQVLYNSLEDVALNKGIPQYPASLAAVDEVISGRRRQGTAVWRCRWADGILYEVKANFYAIYNDGRLMSAMDKCVPDRMLIISSPNEAVTVGDELVADVV